MNGRPNVLMVRADERERCPSDSLTMGVRPGRGQAAHHRRGTCSQNASRAGFGGVTMWLGDRRCNEGLR